jgi:hypothetical protein
MAPKSLPDSDWYHTCRSSDCPQHDNSIFSFNAGLYDVEKPLPPTPRPEHTFDEAILSSAPTACNSQAPTACNSRASTACNSRAPSAYNSRSSSVSSVRVKQFTEPRVPVPTPPDAPYHLMTHRRKLLYVQSVKKTLRSPDGVLTGSRIVWCCWYLWQPASRHYPATFTSLPWTSSPMP